MSRDCEKLHAKFSGLDRFCDDYSEKKMPDNGIYVVFESGAGRVAYWPECKY